MSNYDKGLSGLYQGYYDVPYLEEVSKMLSSLVVGSAQIRHAAIKDAHIESVTTDKIEAGTAKISTALIEDLIVGENVTMGAGASITWDQISGSKPPQNADNTFGELLYNSGIRGFVQQPDGNLYISADYIRAGTISGDRVIGGVLEGSTLSMSGSYYINPEDWFDTGYELWQVNAVLRPLGFKGSLTNAIKVIDYGFNPNEVYGSTSGGNSFNGFELTSGVTYNYTELNSLFGQHLTIGIKSGGRGSSRTEAIAVNPNYTYIRNYLYAESNLYTDGYIRAYSYIQASSYFSAPDYRIGGARIFVDGARLKIEWGSFAMWADNGGTVYFRVNGVNKHVFYFNGTHVHYPD